MHILAVGGLGSVRVEDLHGGTTLARFAPPNQTPFSARGVRRLKISRERRNLRQTCPSPRAPTLRAQAAQRMIARAWVGVSAMARIMMVGAATALLLVSDAAMADAGAVTVWRGSTGASGVERASTAGVTVYRAPRPVEDELAGAGSAQSMPDTQVIIVECRRPPWRIVRTQGFYSGHPGSSRRFTQGFWSGPADLPKSSVRVIRTKR